MREFNECQGEAPPIPEEDTVDTAYMMSFEALRASNERLLRLRKLDEENTRLDDELDKMLERARQSPFADPRSVTIVSIEQIDEDDYVCDAEFEEIKKLR